MTVPKETQAAIKTRGRILAENYKARILSEFPTLISLMREFRVNSLVTMQKYIQLGIMDAVGPQEAGAIYEAIFGKTPAYAADLIKLGEKLGNDAKAGMLHEVPTQKSIMQQYHIAHQDTFKKYIIIGLELSVGKTQAPKIYESLFGVKASYANNLIVLGEKLGSQVKAGTIFNFPTLASIMKEHGITNALVAKKYLLVGIAQSVGVANAERVYEKIFDRGRVHKNADLIVQLGFKLGTAAKAGTLADPPTLASIKRQYAFSSHLIVKYLKRGIAMAAGEAETERLYQEIFGKTPDYAPELIKLGAILGAEQKAGTLINPPSLSAIKQKFRIKNAMIAKKYLLIGIAQTVGAADAERVYDAIFAQGKVLQNAHEIIEIGEQLLSQYETHALGEHQSLAQMAEELQVSQTTVAKYIFEAFAAKVGEQKAEVIFQKLFAQEVPKLVGALNHPILEHGLQEVIESSQVGEENRIQVFNEKLEGDVKHDLLIQNIKAVNWIREEIGRQQLKANPIWEILQMYEQEFRAFTRISVDFTTWEDFKRVKEKIEKYASKDTLLIIAITAYSEAEKNLVRQVRGVRNARIISAWLLFQLFGANAASLERVETIRNWTKRRALAELKALAEQVKEGTAPSFVKGQQDLGKWLPKPAHTASSATGKEKKQGTGKKKRKTKRKEGGAEKEVQERDRGAPDPGALLATIVKALEGPQAAQQPAGVRLAEQLPREERAALFVVEGAPLELKCQVTLVPQEHGADVFFNASQPPQPYARVVQGWAQHISPGALRAAVQRQLRDTLKRQPF